MTVTQSIVHCIHNDNIPGAHATVGLTFYSIFAGVGDKKEEVFRKISVFLLEHNIKLNIDPVIEAISSLIENAGKIGGIGAIIMVLLQPPYCARWKNHSTISGK